MQKPMELDGKAQSARRDQERHGALTIMNSFADAERPARVPGVLFVENFRRRDMP